MSARYARFGFPEDAPYHNPAPGEGGDEGAFPNPSEAYSARCDLTEYVVDVAEGRRRGRGPSNRNSSPASSSPYAYSRYPSRSSVSSSSAAAAAAVGSARANSDAREGE